MANHIIGKPFERDVRVVLPHPHIERIVQEEIRQERADYSSLWGPLLPTALSAVSHLNRRSQPPFDIEHHPFTVGMFPYRPHQEVMIDCIKETLDIEIKHPVVTPAPLPCHSYGFLG